MPLRQLQPLRCINSGMINVFSALRAAGFNVCPQRLSILSPPRSLGTCWSKCLFIYHWWLWFIN